MGGKTPAWDGIQQVAEVVDMNKSMAGGGWMNGRAGARFEHQIYQTRKDPGSITPARTTASKILAGTEH